MAERNAPKAAAANPGRREWLTTVALICVSATFGTVLTWLSISGRMLELVSVLGNAGVTTTVIYMGCQAVSVQPWAWGWSVSLMIAGMAWGWRAVPLSYFGLMAGSSFAFISCRHLLRDWVQKKRQSLTLKTRRRLQVLETGIVKGKCGFVMLTAIRPVPVNIGWQTALISLLDVSYCSFFWSTLIGETVVVVSNVYIGRVLRKALLNGNGEAGDDDEAAGGEKKEFLYIEIAFAVLMAAGVALYGRALLHYADKEFEKAGLKDIDPVAASMRPQKSAASFGTARRFSNQTTMYEGQGQDRRESGDRERVRERRDTDDSTENLVMDQEPLLLYQPSIPDDALHPF